MNNQTVTQDVSILARAESTESLDLEVTSIEAKAAGIVITTEGEYKEASAVLRDIKTMQKKVDEYWEPMRLSTKKAYDDVLAHKKEMTNPLKEAETIIKKKIADYTTMLEAKQREMQERARQLAMQESKSKMDEAIRLQQNGDEVGAEYALDEAMMMDEVASSQMILQTEKPKANGVSTQKSWKITSIDESVVPIDVNGAVIRPVDEKAVMALIKATKGKIQIPGIKYEETVVVSARAN